MIVKQSECFGIHRVPIVAHSHTHTHTHTHTHYLISHCLLENDTKID